MDEKNRGFWFPAKRYGWGWGPPLCWQGWLVLAIYCASILAAIRHFMPAHDHGGFVLSSLVATALFIAVVAWKGEKPLAWRWGGRSRRLDKRGLAELGISAEMIAAKKLQAYPEAKTLDIAEIGSDGREHRLTPDATSQWRKMKAAAQADGIEMFIVSAFRSVERQTQIIRNKINAGQSLTDILNVSAPPGYSEHHTGRAIDIGTTESENLSLEFGDSRAFAWLQRHAHEFGFAMSYPPGNSSGYQYEPWHWCLMAEAEST